MSKRRGERKPRLVLALKDSWVATRFGLKRCGPSTERGLVGMNHRRAAYELVTLNGPERERLWAFLADQGIHYEVSA